MYFVTKRHVQDKVGNSRGLAEISITFDHPGDTPTRGKLLLIPALSLLFLTSLLGASNRATVSLNDDWKFKRQDAARSEQITYDDAHWEKIRVPHTWNAVDGFDDLPGYYRGVGTYRKRFEVNSAFKGQHISLHFESACQVSRLWINGHFLGEFYSGYTGFSVEISQYVESSPKENILTLKVNNSNDRDVPPWSPQDPGAYPRSIDFNVYGGINSDVYLLITSPIRIATHTITTPSISSQSVTTHTATIVENHTTSPVEGVLQTELIDAGGKVLNVTRETNWIRPAESVTFKQETRPLAQPKLWAPGNPYLYRIRSRLYVQDRQVDEIESDFGMRWFEWRPFKGLFLNGRKLFLRGVSRHQEFPGQGNALSNAQHVRDMELIKRLGANYVRLAHYPQDPAVLDACDRLGLVVWEEIPVAISVGGTPEFTENAVQILREMIRRDRNHPSILFWGLMNETTEGIPYASGIQEQDVVDLMIELKGVAREEDPTRLTLASGVTPAVSEHVDLEVSQFWSGWLMGEFEDYGKELDNRRERIPVFMGGSYGASSQIGRHSESPERMDFSETYQCLLHESYLKQAEARSSWYAGACAWTAFDFGSNREDRASNPLPYVNQKGLFDAHRNPKDVFYLYRSYWTEEPLFVYIVSKTWTERTGDLGSPSEVRVYSNCPRVELLLNGASQGDLDKQGGFVWQVRFLEGTNELEARGFNTNGTATTTDNLTVNFIPR